MSNKLWNSIHSLKPAETSSGKKVIQDYFGLHRETNAKTAVTTAIAHGVNAQIFADESERRRLNVGKMFHGFIARRHVSPVFLYIAEHPEYGLCAYVDQNTSRPPTEIEVLINRTKDRVIIKTNSFFDQLPTKPLSAEEIESVCSDYRRNHIQMNQT